MAELVSHLRTDQEVPSLSLGRFHPHLWLPWTLVQLNTEHRLCLFEVLLPQSIVPISISAWSRPMMAMFWSSKIRYQTLFAGKSYSLAPEGRWVSRWLATMQRNLRFWQTNTKNPPRAALHSRLLRFLTRVVRRPHELPEVRRSAKKRS